MKVSLKKPENMTPAEINREIGKLEEGRGKIIGRLGALRLRLALDACPYQVGEILVNQRGDRARIDNIGTSKHYGEKYQLSGVYLKKDGTPAVNPGRDNDRPRACHFEEYDKWKRPEA